MGPRPESEPCVQTEPVQGERAAMEEYEPCIESEPHDGTVPGDDKRADHLVRTGRRERGTAN